MGCLHKILIALVWLGLPFFMMHSCTSNTSPQTGFLGIGDFFFETFLYIVGAIIFSCLGMIFEKISDLRGDKQYKKYKKEQITYNPDLPRLERPEIPPKFYGGAVYMIKATNPHNQVWFAYIGESVQVDVRWATHKQELINQTHHNKRLQDLFNNGYILQFHLLHCIPRDETGNSDKGLLHKLERFYWFCLNKKQINDDPYLIDCKQGKENSSGGININSYYPTQYGYEAYIGGGTHFKNWQEIDASKARTYDD